MSNETAVAEDDQELKDMKEQIEQLAEAEKDKAEETPHPEPVEEKAPEVPEPEAPVAQSEAKAKDINPMEWRKVNTRRQRTWQERYSERSRVP